MKPRLAFEQIQFLWYEISLLANRRPWRYWSVLFSDSFWVVASYRLDRCLYLFFGKPWRVVRVALSPLAFLLRPWLSRCDVHFEASIGKGFKILHPCLGAVVPRYAVIGEHLTLTGGNCIGMGRKGGLQTGDVSLGDHVLLGANAVVLGPIRIGNHVTISAGSVAVRDIGDSEVVGGVPAKVLFRQC